VIKAALPYRIVAFPAEGRIQVLRFDDIVKRNRELAGLEAAGVPALACTVDGVVRGGDEVGFHRP
jgi:hypothetical protein